MHESQLVRKILQELRNNYPESVFYKIYIGPYQERGIPDILGCHRKRFVALEVKTPERKVKEVTVYQARQLAKIKKAGGIIGVVSSVQEALNAIA